MPAYKNNNVKIGFGGGCHWCTEAVFQAIKGVGKVEQGWIKITKNDNDFSEAVIIHYNMNKLNLEDLIKVHLQTHSSTSNHSMRKKYRSAVYYFTKEQEENINKILVKLQTDFKEKIITKAYPYLAFKPSPESFQNYFLKNPNKPFCKRYINPKLELIDNKIKK